MTSEKKIFKIYSSSFLNGEPIPAKFTCDGDNLSPDLAWSNAPSETKSLALIVDDPDAPDPKKPLRVWAHWVLANISPQQTSLEENSPLELEGMVCGTNDWKHIHYDGPCPPIGRHRYFFKLYALDAMLSDLHHPTKAELEAAMKNHILDQCVLMGTYDKT